jgi:SHS2 domain-containing protein
MSTQAGYRITEHTADVGIVAWGPDPSSAFAEATKGMFAIVLGQDPQEWRGSGQTRVLDVEVEGQTWDELLVNWLAELVFHFDVDGFVPVQTGIEECAPPRCSAHLEGVLLDDPEEAGGVGIKAVTYHQLAVRVGEGRTELRVIFDI